MMKVQSIMLMMKVNVNHLYLRTQMSQRIHSLTLVMKIQRHKSYITRRRGEAVSFFMGYKLSSFLRSTKKRSMAKNISKVTNWKWLILFYVNIFMLIINLLSEKDFIKFSSFLNVLNILNKVKIFYFNKI